jgi:hypothetical protein
VWRESKRWLLRQRKVIERERERGREKGSKEREGEKGDRERERDLHFVTCYKAIDFFAKTNSSEPLFNPITNFDLNLN